jgi:ribonucleotide reductase alpha subunit
MKFIETHKETIDNAIDYSKDFNYSYFGFKTLQRLYLLKVEKNTPTPRVKLQTNTKTD